MAREDLKELVRRMLKEAPFSMRQLAEEAGLSYDALRAWTAGRHVPERESIRKLTVALKRRAIRLEDHAEALEQAAKSDFPAGEETSAE